MELDFAIDRTGNVAPAHAALYEAFGNWRRACYGTPLASAPLPAGAMTITLELAPADGPGVARQGSTDASTVRVSLWGGSSRFHLWGSRLEP